MEDPGLDSTRDRPATSQMYVVDVSYRTVRNDGHEGDCRQNPLRAADASRKRHAESPSGRGAAPGCQMFRESELHGNEKTDIKTRHLDAHPLTRHV